MKVLEPHLLRDLGEYPKRVTGALPSGHVLNPNTTVLRPSSSTTTGNLAIWFNASLGTVFHLFSSRRASGTSAGA
jgi:hypothetical protein